MENTQSDINKAGTTALSVFNGNTHFSNIYKKTERLVTALYMITNFIEDSEPLKYKIRQKALELLTLNISFNSVSLSERRNLLKKYQAHATEIISLSTVASHASLISEMNGQILRREFTNLLSMIEDDSNKKDREQTVVFSADFFGTVESIEQAEKKVTAPDVLYTSPVPERVEAKVQQSQVVTSLKDIREKPQPVVRQADSKDDRQGSIIKLLSKKSGLNIKDFEGIIKGVSAKTIQRELLAMVASGILKKEGERRWSTYSLAQ